MEERLFCLTISNMMIQVRVLLGLICQAYQLTICLLIGASPTQYKKDKLTCSATEQRMPTGGDPSPKHCL